MVYIDEGANADWIKHKRATTVELGDLPGHEFHGNQWTGGKGEDKPEVDPQIQAWMDRETKLGLSDPTPERYREVVEFRNTPTWEQHAEEHGMTLDEYKAATEDHLKTLFADSEVKMRVPPDVLDQIIETGDFRNQHQTGESFGGGYVPDLRTKVEDALHGEASDADRPKYGYLDDGSFWDDSSVEQYGDIEITFKDSVRDRTSVTLGDSMDELGVRPAVMLGMGSFAQSTAEPINDPKITFTQYGDALEAQNLRDLVDDANVQSDNPPSFVETQLHGSLTVDDIASVEDLGGDMSLETSMALTDMGITVVR